MINESFKAVIFKRNLKKIMSCVICLKSKIIDKVVVKGCGHAFCKLCIVEWTKYKNSCPTCRNNIEEIEMNSELFTIYKGTRFRIKDIRKKLIDWKKTDYDNITNINYGYNGYYGDKILMNHVSDYLRKIHNDEGYYKYKNLMNLFNLLYNNILFMGRNKIFEDTVRKKVMEVSNIIDDDVRGVFLECELFMYFQNN